MIISTDTAGDTETNSIISAYLENERAIIARLSRPMQLPYQPGDLLINNITTGETLAIAEVTAAASSTETQSELVEILLAQGPDVSHTLQITFKGSLPYPITPRNCLSANQYMYSGDDLGNTFSPQGTSFRVWAPTASAVEVLLYDSENGPLSRQIAMQSDMQGTWWLYVQENLENWYYLYQVTVHGSRQTAVDPYVKAIAVNAERGMIIDLKKTNPDGWEIDGYRKLESAVDAVIYEVHIRDFSIAINSGMINKGQYLAFTERGTKGPEAVATGVDSLRQLGITHVQILPVEEFASVDENTPSQYNWGYDPRNFNVPEGAYATTPHGTARISEYKRMIQSLHGAQLGVVMDVVYNHTYGIGDSDFDKIVPQYYYRTDGRGKYSNGSGVGNELATERPMVQKFVRDSLTYWVKEYHIDGFRFDLMALLGVETMRQVAQDLHEINPGVLLYGEPWTGGPSALAGEQLLLKGRQKGLGVGVFNDNMRNGLIGSVFNRQAQGFVSGANNEMVAIEQGVTGSIHDFTTGPEETINYVSCHDNLTLWDKIAASTPEANEEQRIKMDMLGQAVILTAQGVAFLHGGEEFLRTKGGNENSYNAGDAVNGFDWARKAKYIDVFQYYAGLIHLRNHHPALRMRTAEEINQHLTFIDGPANTVSFIIRDHANGDPWSNMLVIYNPNQTDITCKLPEGTWVIAVGQGQVNEEGLNHVTGQVTVSGISCIVLFQR